MTGGAILAGPTRDIWPDRPTSPMIASSQPGAGQASDQRQARPSARRGAVLSSVVKFLRHGCEQLLTQLLGFGGEKHDDAVDALVYLILGLVGEGIEEQKVHYV